MKQFVFNFKRHLFQDSKRVTMKECNFIKLPIILILIFLMSGCTEEETVPTSFTDTRDGTVYAIVEIGTQVWFAENLNFETDSSVCFDLDDANCEIYGRMYDWNTAMTACPDGWRLPSSADWETLLNELGGESVAGGKLKETGLTHWNDPNIGAADEVGFTALPAGYHTSGGSFKSLGDETNWWSSTEVNMTDADNLYIYYDDIEVFWSDPEKTDMYSCRCIQN